MTDQSLSQLLGTGARDPGCEAMFEAADQYIDALLRGDDVTVRYAEVLTHLQNCAACREDAEGLLAALQDIEFPSPDR